MRMGVAICWNECKSKEPHPAITILEHLALADDSCSVLEELVFMAAKGLQIGAIQIATVDGIEDQELQSI